MVEFFSSQVRCSVFGVAFVAFDCVQYTFCRLLYAFSGRFEIDKCVGFSVKRGARCGGSKRNTTNRFLNVFFFFFDDAIKFNYVLWVIFGFCFFFILIYTVTKYGEKMIQKRDLLKREFCLIGIKWR